jgi:putative FmdB family regulatory protein
MPTYEYECTACSHRFEQFQSMSESPLKECPECGGALRRLIGAGGGIIMRGGASQSGGKTCSLENTSTTCCGRQERCDKPPCRNEE